MRVANFGRVWFWLLSHAMRHVCMHACAAPPPPFARSDTLTGWFGDGLVSDTVTMLRYNNTDSPPCLHPPSPSAPPCIHAVFSRKSPCPPSPHRCYSPPPLSTPEDGNEGQEEKDEKRMCGGHRDETWPRYSFENIFFNKQNMYNCSFSPQKSYICFLFNHSVGL